MSEMIYGIHAVQALLERAPERFQEVFILKGREDKRLLPLIHALESQGVVIQLANRQYLDEKSDGRRASGHYRSCEARTAVSGKRSAGSDRFARSTVPADPRRRNRSAQPRRVPA